MSKAEERALERFPVHEGASKEWIESHLKGICSDYIEGYHQAEKDLELSWEDMMIIHRCIKDAMNYHLYKMMESVEGQKVVYQEVLKRFNKERKENEVQD